MAEDRVAAYACSGAGHHLPACGGTCGEIEDAASARYRVLWGLGRYEDFDTPAEADARADEIHSEMVATWPLLAGTSDGSLPRVTEVPDAS